MRKRSLLIGSAATLSAIAFLPGCHAPAAPAGHVPLFASPAPIKGTDNFSQVAPGIYRGAQPSADGFLELERREIRTVLNLRMYHDDADLYHGSKIRLVHIPCSAWSIGESDLVRALAIINDPKNHPVFVHCAHGADRTGYVIAGYRRVIQGWDQDEALRELYSFGFHPIWFNVPFQVRGIDPARVRAKL